MMSWVLTLCSLSASATLFELGSLIVLFRVGMGMVAPNNPNSFKRATSACGYSLRCSNSLAVGNTKGDDTWVQVPGKPQTAYSHVYGAPGISGVNILTR